MTSLVEYLRAWAGEGEARAQIAATVAALAEGAVRVAAMLAEGPQEGDEEVGSRNAALRAAGLMTQALQGSPVAFLATETMDVPVAVTPGAHLAVALDPLDGAQNAAIGAPCGTIFSILPVRAVAGSHGSLAFLQQGDRQIGAGCVLYGHCTTLALTLREGTDLFVLDRGAAGGPAFRLAAARRDGAVRAHVYAINAANYRLWSESVRAYVDDCIAGEDGPRGADFNMRWLGCVTAEAMRILQRGGIYLYPGDSRRRPPPRPAAPGVRRPSAGAAAGAGRRRRHRRHDADPEIRRAPPERAGPLVFGSREKVDRVAGYETMRLPLGERSPLFGRRGLFRV